MRLSGIHRPEKLPTRGDYGGWQPNTKPVRPIRGRTKLRVWPVSALKDAVLTFKEPIVMRQDLMILRMPARAVHRQAPALEAASCGRWTMYRAVSRDVESQRGENFARGQP